MKCHKCGFDNLDEANFCIKCGARLDQKIPCPKCGEYISNDEEKCPHCGRMIPHKKESNLKKNEEAKSVRNNIASTFNRVSTFITLFVLIFLLSLSFTNILSFPSEVSQVPDFYRFFIYQWSGFNDISNFERTLRIARAAIYAVDLCVSIGFTITAIIKVGKAFRNSSLINNTYKYVAIMIAAKLMTATLLVASYPSVYNPTVSSLFTSITGLAVLHLSICLGFDCYMHFERGKVSIFIARIILALGLYLPLLILVGFRDKSFVEQNGFIYHYFDMLFTLISRSYVDGFISNFVLASISFVLAIAILSVAYSLIVYFTSAYFRGMNKFKRFRIVFYMTVITLTILSSIYLISSIVEFSLYETYVQKGLVFSATPVSTFIYTFLLMGVAVTTFNIYNRANRRALLEEKTTIVD